MEISFIKELLNKISSFLHLASVDNINLDPAWKYYKRVEEILKLLKPVLDAIVDCEIVFHEGLNKAFEELARFLDELRELFGSWQPLSSKVYFVLRTESLISKIRNSSLDIFNLLKTSEEHLPDELSSEALELFLQKIEHMGCEEISSSIEQAVKGQKGTAGPSAEILVKVGESLGLRSNQEILIEAVALEKLKENAEQAEKAAEVEFTDQLIGVITRLHDRLVLLKQSQTSSPVPIPPDFCCPLSLELMSDPVIVASGQTYERGFIKKWIDLGLTVCPKTRQTLSHTNLITNYTVKALIANWCESNKIKLPDPTKDPSKSPDHIVSNRPVSPESIWSTGSSGKNLISSSGIQRGGTSPLHPRADSESSLSAATGNGGGLDSLRIQLNNSEDGSTIGTASRRESFDAVEHEELPQNHIRSASVSSNISNADFPQGPLADVNGNSNDASSGQLNSRYRMMSIQPNVFSPRFARDTLVPRIVSSSTVETRADLSGLEEQVKKLVEDLKSPSVDTQREATGELRLLAKHNMDNRIVIANSGAIALLVELLMSTDSKIQENAVTALLNLSINDNSKATIANAGAIEPLIHVLRNGSPEAKENSAATLFSLSVIEENKMRIGRSGAIGPLVDLLGNGTPRGKKDAATALFNLSIYHENKARIVQAGAVRHLVDLMDPAAGMVDKAVAVLANLATIPEGRSSIGQEGGIPVLVEVVELGSARGKENAAAALLQLCTNSSRFCNMVLQEGAVPPLVALSQSGTPRAKEKAQTLLSYFRNQRHGNSGRG